MQLVHDKIKPYKCDICPWAFGLLSGLNKHKRYVHEKEKNFECPHCKRKIARKEDLVNHIKVVHEKLRPFSCDKCEYVCSSKSNLIKHKHVMHTNLIAELPCLDCGKLFKTKEKVKSHFQQVHNPAKPNSCDKCKFTSVTKSSLRKHQYKRHTNLTPQLPCTDCDKLFKTKDSIRLHYRNVHGNKKSTIKVEQNECKPQLVDLRSTLEVPIDLESEMDLLGDLVNDYDMGEELSETLEQIKKISCPEQKPTMMKSSSNVPPKIKTEELIEQADAIIDGLTRIYKNSLSRSELEDSGFDSARDALTPRHTVSRSQPSRIPTAVPSSNTLEIYSSSITKEPMSNHQWILVEKFIIDQLTTEISTGAISPLQVIIAKSGYDVSQKMGFIETKDSNSMDWYKRKIAKFNLDGMSFRAWSEHEVAEFYNFRLAVPTKLDAIQEGQLLPLLVAFNPNLKTCQLKVSRLKVVENVGRYFFLQVCKDGYKYIEENNWKLDFLMGEVEIVINDKEC
jgi:KRAB domain-containing zinc finger protein